MSYNGSGVWTATSIGQPVVATTLITAAAHNALVADIATGLSTAICRDGQSTITANIPLGGHKITGLGEGQNATDAASLAVIQDGVGVYADTVGGTADAITLTMSPAITGYGAGQTFRFKASGANTGAVTVAINGLSAEPVTKNGATALVAGDIASGAIVTITYDGARFILTATNTAILNSPTINTPTLTTPAITGGTMTQVPITVNSQSAAYATLLTDGGKFLLHPTADNNARTFTIDGSLAYPVGITITFVNQINVLTIAISTDAMTLAGTSSAGNRTLAVNGIATALKVASGAWLISGTGLA